MATASPHTRGWTRVLMRRPSLWVGFPAHAGMDLDWSGSAWRGSGLPRTRGDGPVIEAIAGANSQASPHTRGWTALVAKAPEPEAGFPAHAGMDPGQQIPTGVWLRLPRTRGDGPDTQTPNAE